MAAATSPVAKNFPDLIDSPQARFVRTIAFLRSQYAQSGASAQPLKWVVTLLFRDCRTSGGVSDQLASYLRPSRPPICRVV